LQIRCQWATNPAEVTKSGFIRNLPHRADLVGQASSLEAGRKEQKKSRNNLKISPSARKFLFGKE
jgi:hypothetical protein